MRKKTRAQRGRKRLKSLAWKQTQSGSGVRPERSIRAEAISTVMRFRWLLPDQPGHTSTADIGERQKEKLNTKQNQTIHDKNSWIYTEIKIKKDFPSLSTNAHKCFILIYHVKSQLNTSNLEVVTRQHVDKSLCAMFATMMTLWHQWRNLGWRCKVSHKTLESRGDL